MSDALNLVRRIPELAEKAKTAESILDPVYQTFSNGYNRIAAYYRLPAMTTENVRDGIIKGMAFLKSIKGEANSESNTLVDSKSTIASLSRIGETIAQAAKRIKKNSSLYQFHNDADMVVTSIPDPIEETVYSPPSWIEQQLTKVSIDKRVNAVNGGTFDVIASTGSLGTANSGCRVESSSAVTYSHYMCGPSTAVANVSSANALTRSWVKTNIGSRTVAVLFHSDGTGYSVNPKIRVKIPSGVPRGRLVVTGHRHSVGSYFVDNTGAGADLAFASGFDTEGATLEVADSSQTYWTWTDSKEDNEEYRYSRFVSKNTRDSVEIDITLTLDPTASTTFAVFLDFNYHPSNVRLKDLNMLNVDISESDPIMTTLNMIMQFDDYNRSRQVRSWIDILNGILNTTYSSSVLYPQNWNTLDFGVSSFDDFLNEWIKTFNMQIDNILLSPEFYESL